ncbi:hypothetical protein BH09VER1_BH09VER1_16180 [soil metagenome]
MAKRPKAFNSSMERAFDTFQNQLVFAFDCDREGYFPDRFVCPCCEKGVFFAAGVIQKPHFKHATGYDPKCELAVAGLAQGTFGDIEAELRDASIVAQFSTQDGQLSCSFVVRYRPALSIDSINVVMGSHDKDYQLHGRREIEIPLTEATEVVVISAAVGERVVVRRFVKAFEATPSIFRRTSSQSVKFPQHRVLHPGAYVAVFEEDDEEIQFPLVCEAVQIGCSFGLKAFAFVIPPSPNFRVLNFCRETFGMSVKVRNFDYAILEPLALVEESPDVWTTNMEGEAAMLIASKTQLGVATKIVGQFRDRIRLHAQSEDVTLSATPHLVKFAVGKEHPLIRIGIGSPPQFLAEIRYLDSIPEPTATRFRFKFKDASGDTVRVCRSSWRLLSMFDRVRAGEIAVESIEHSPFVELAVVHRSKRVGLDDDTAGAVLTDLLRNETSALRIVATGYPAIFIPSPMAIPRLKAPEQRSVLPVGRVISRRRRHARAQILGVSSPYAAFAQKS